MPGIVVEVNAELGGWSLLNVVSCIMTLTKTHYLH